MLVKAPKMEMKGEWPGDTEGQGQGVGSLACVSRALKAEMRKQGPGDTERKSMREEAQHVCPGPCLRCTSDMVPSNSHHCEKTPSYKSQPLATQSSMKQLDQSNYGQNTKSKGNFKAAMRTKRIYLQIQRYQGRDWKAEGSKSYLPDLKRS